MDRLLPKPMTDPSQRVKQSSVGATLLYGGQRVPPFRFDFATRLFPVTDEVVGSDEASVWCGAWVLEWVLA